MSKENLISEIKDAVILSLGSGYEVSIKKTLKNNGLELTGIMIRRKGDMVSPVIYIDQFLELYESGASATAIAKKIIGIYTEKIMTGCPDITSFTDFNSLKDKIIFQLVNTERNAALLKEIPSVPFLDFSIIFKILLLQTADEMITTTITNDYMAVWNVNKDTVYKAALANTPILQECVVTGMNDMLSELTGGIFSSGSEFYVMTNQNTSCGCGCILYPHVLEDFSERVGMDFYILPSSIHEVLLVPGYGNDSLSLIKIVGEVNRTVVEQEDFLSDNVYYYSRKNKKITIV